jgi:predicted DNA-binding transcriptional regulator AlpA
MMDQSEDVRLLSEREVGRRLEVSRHSLRYWRARGEGPPWCRVGRRLVRYPLAELRRWIAERAAAQR